MEAEIRAALDRHWAASDADDFETEHEIYREDADGRPSYTVSIMEFRDGKVARETQYFGDPFEPGPSRAHLVERMA
jgi:hypothetical protein